MDFPVNLRLRQYRIGNVSESAISAAPDVYRQRSSRLGDGIGHCVESMRLGYLDPPFYAYSAQPLSRNARLRRRGLSRHDLHPRIVDYRRGSFRRMHRNGIAQYSRAGIQLRLSCGQYYHNDSGYHPAGHLHAANHDFRMWHFHGLYRHRHFSGAGCRFHPARNSLHQYACDLCQSNHRCEQLRMEF